MNCMVNGPIGHIALNLVLVVFIPDFECAIPNWVLKTYALVRVYK